MIHRVLCSMFVIARESPALFFCGNPEDFTPIEGRPGNGGCRPPINVLRMIRNREDGGRL